MKWAVPRKILKETVYVTNDAHADMFIVPIERIFKLKISAV